MLSNDSFACTNRVNVNRSYVANALNQYISAGPANFAHYRAGRGGEAGRQSLLGWQRAL